MKSKIFSNRHFVFFVNRCCQHTIKMPSPSKNRFKNQPWCKRLLNKRLPIVNWLPEYNSDKAVADLIAGITVGLTVIPQALAYATLAGLDPQVRQRS